MLWYKAWLETRWRFLIGLAFLVCSAVAVVFTYPYLVTRLAGAIDPAKLDLGSALTAQVREALELSREYRGYVWSQWFRQNHPNGWVVLAALIGTGGLLSQSSGGAALFTLSLPASRRRVLSTRAAIGLGELALLAVIPALVMPLFAPAIGETYRVGDALVFAACLFAGGAVFFSLSFLLSTVFADVWRPPVIAIALFYGLGFFEQVTGTLAGRGIVAVLSGESYFRAGQLPWVGLMASLCLSAAMLYGAMVNIERRDF